MSEILAGFGDRVLTFLLSTGGIFLVGMLFLGALMGLFRGRSVRLRIVCGGILLFCLLYGAFLIWLGIGFGSSSHPPTPLQP